MALWVPGSATLCWEMPESKLSPPAALREG